ncbi:MAG: serine--tRNA ligase [Bdellovibrionales bacterium]|nr:serine--tRNA ligase [Bdellovibrionales bacterium]
MLDLKYIRENVEAVKTAITQKKVNLNLDQLLGIDQDVLNFKKRLQALQEEKNANAKKMPKATPEERPGLIERGRAIGQEITKLEPEVTSKEEELKKLLWLTPMVPASDVPVGKDDSENVERRKVGTPPEFVFAMKDHVDVILKNNWAEFERIAKVCGSRMIALKNELALYEFAVIRYSLDYLTKKGSQIYTVPAMVREEALYGTGHFPAGREQVYHLPEDDIYLSGTAEVPMTSVFSGEILNESQLPMRIGAFSPCFRREAGSAGKDVRGLMRVHQFNKVEQFVFCRNDADESAYWHNEILKTSEEICQAFELPYRVIEVCTGDMGAGKFRMHDIECWVPSEKRYRETHSCSSLHDWQARRANLRYRDKEDKVKYMHTLNNTAAATPRLLIALIENHQCDNGAIHVPKALQPYMGGVDRIGGK